MRTVLVAAAALALCGCTALMLGGGSPGQGPGGSGRPAAPASTDSGTTAAIRSRLRADPVLGAFDLRVETLSNRVTLRGSVSTYAARKRAGDIAASVDNVVAVDNRIGVAGN